MKSNTPPVKKMFIKHEQVKKYIYSVIKLNTTTLLTEKFKEVEALKPHNTRDVTTYLKSFYENDPIEFNQNYNNRAAVKPQLVKLQSQLNNFGLNK